MCGIVGVVWADPSREGDRGPLEAGLTSITHRGPDDAGAWVTPGFTAGMRRLSIIDIAGGHQPVFNESGTVGVVFNGEIYNFKQLRRRCEALGHSFATDSDTEVLVHLYEELGSDLVRELDGMFAFAIWDSRNRRALIARDRFGVKPLHLHRSSEGLAFASELKALAAAGWLEPTLDSSAIAQYLHYGYVPERASMWQGAERLFPGHFIEVSEGRPGKPTQYHRHRIGGSEIADSRDVDAELKGLLRDAVERQLVADVPVGLFLSGGLDSSLIAAMAVRCGADVPCHTIQFRATDHGDDPWDDDAPHAQRVAEHFGLRLHVHTMSPNVVDLLPRLIRTLDEPSGDPAIIPAYLIAEAARPVTKVLLSGMGADEIAGGYRRHVAARLAAPFYRLPSSVRTVARRLGQILSNELLASGVSSRPLLRRARKLAAQLPSKPRAFPESLAGWTLLETLTSLGLEAPESIWASVERLVDGNFDDPLAACLAFDLSIYLPSHNLHYMDKATMAASVETRVPFLDNEFARFMLALPADEKVRFGTTKYALRRAAAGFIPQEVIRRPKTGFGAPIRSWLKRELRPMVHDYLSPASVVRRGLFEPGGIARILNDFDRDVGDLSYPLWFLFSLEVWCREVMDLGGSGGRDAPGRISCAASLP